MKMRKFIFRYSENRKSTQFKKYYFGKKNKISI